MEIKFIIDDRIVRALRPIGALASSRRAALGAAALVVGTGVAAIAAPAVKPNTFAAGDPVVAADINDNFDTIYDAFNAHVIREDTTFSLAVGDGCQGLIDTLAGLEDARIVSSATVTIELAAGSYTCPSRVSVDHPNGKNIEIVGTGAAPDDVVLNFPANSDGITVQTGRALGRIENLTLSGSSTTGGAGIRSDQASVVGWVQDVIVRNFWDGVYVVHSSNLNGDNVTATDNVNVGIFSFRGSSVRVSNATATNNLVGFYSTYSSDMVLDNPTSNGNTSRGFDASLGGSMRAVTPTSTGDEVAFRSQRRGAMYTSDATMSNCGAMGTLADNGGFIQHGGAVNGQGTGGCNDTPTKVSGNTLDTSVITD